MIDWEQSKEAHSVTNGLAIIIPAFKGAFLMEALESIANQTSKNFVLYVGDDASPEDILSICHLYADRIDLRYTRFHENLGRIDLVKHWNRCVELSREPWVWLFSDDDIMDSGCIAAVLKAINSDNGRFDLYHFDVQEINANGQVTRPPVPFPEVISSLEFAMARCRHQLFSYAPDYVFLRSALKGVGSFQSFPLAWCADDATWIKVGRRGGIRTLQGPKVHWRKSGQNITSQRPELAQQKLAAASQYVGWLGSYLLNYPPERNEVRLSEIRRWALEWLRAHQCHLGVTFLPGIWFLSGWHLRKIARYGAIEGWLLILYWDLRFIFQRWR